MNVEFKILWFEDADEWYKPTKEDIENYIIELSFKPEFTRLKAVSESDIKTILTENSFDLIFADLNLERKEKGDKAIKLIRENNVLADVLFYSTDGIRKIKQVAQVDMLEGVYLSSREEDLFPVKAKQLIDKIVRRSEDILNVRGLLMDNVSEFDEKLKTIILNYISICNNKDDIDELNRYAYEKVSSQLENHIKKIKKIEGDFIRQAMEQSFFIDSYKLSMITEKILQKYPDFIQNKKFHKDYDIKILKERNQLAHAKKEPLSKTLFYFVDTNGKKISYDSKKCREIRQSINEYHEFFDDIITKINKNNAVVSNHNDKEAIHE
ncbi:hypothetical protein V1L52_01440 [Treponema sp. HNW]|uniref:hypothetical protein n=1 Tax=Treponema sp. HNW TaxID=3116654 RepID=UPI003D0F1150